MLRYYASVLEILLYTSIDFSPYLDEQHSKLSGTKPGAALERDNSGMKVWINSHAKIYPHKAFILPTPCLDITNTISLTFLPKTHISN